MLMNIPKLNISRSLGKALLAVAVMAATAAGLQAQTTAAQVFANAPDEVFPLLDKNTRLDMIDYYNSGMTTASGNNVNGKSRITRLTPQALDIEMSAASDYQLSLIPMAGDSLVALIVTVKSPAPDSRIDFYDSGWHHMADGKYFAKPSMTDWLTDEGRKNAADVDAFVPFLLVSYSYSPETGLLTLTNNTKEFLSPDIYEMVGGYLKPQLVYKWNGKKFSPAGA